MEGPGTEDCDDRYPDCSAMVHLRCRQGLAAHAPPATTRDARISQEKVRAGINARRQHVPIGSSNLEKETKQFQFDPRAVPLLNNVLNNVFCLLFSNIYSDYTIQHQQATLPQTIRKK